MESGGCQSPKGRNSITASRISAMCRHPGGDICGHQKHERGPKASSDFLPVGLADLYLIQTLCGLNRCVNREKRGFAQPVYNFMRVVTACECILKSSPRAQKKAAPEGAASLTGRKSIHRHEDMWP